MELGNKLFWKARFGKYSFGKQDFPSPQQWAVFPSSLLLPMTLRLNMVGGSSQLRPPALAAVSGPTDIMIP